jgi:hypothetical protein
LNSQVYTGEEIEAIVNGYHGDAFGILGPHSVAEEQSAALGSAGVSPHAAA